MAYGSVLTDVVQSSTAGTPPQFNDGNGTQTGTLCRAWVNFNGTGTVAIRASFNVSSITDNGTGQYTVNLANAMPDANYATQATFGYTPQTSPSYTPRIDAQTTTTIAVITNGSNGGFTDVTSVYVSIFR